MLHTWIVLAYFGPETYLPLTSTVGAVVGMVLMWGRTPVRLASRWVRRLGRKGQS